MFLGCEKKMKVDTPQNLISKSEMTNILYDMFIMSSSKGASIDVLRNNGIQPDAYVLNKYGIDSLTFITSNDYYAHDIEAYKGILFRIQERIETKKKVLEAEIEKEQSAKKRRSDSIKEIQLKKRNVPINMDSLDTPMKSPTL